MLTIRTADSVITLEKTCQRCRGYGVVSNPAWENFRGDNPSAFAEEHGMPEMVCPVCGGTGTVPTDHGRVFLGFIEKYAK